MVCSVYLIKALIEKISKLIKRRKSAEHTDILSVQDSGYKKSIPSILSLVKEYILAKRVPS